MKYSNGRATVADESGERAQRRARARAFRDAVADWRTKYGEEVPWREVSFYGDHGPGEVTVELNGPERGIR